MTMLVLAAFGLMLAAFALYLRSAIVALNKDMRAILDQQADTRARLAALETYTLAQPTSMAQPTSKDMFP